ncbi:MAG: hypothetical protein Q7U34_00885, partial [Anaerolineales bacterium]|nr:hypothetical protein [Anaerolineales bacterium]
DIARDLASTLDLDILLDRIILAAVDITGAQAASILLYDDTSCQLHFQVATDIDKPLMRGLVVPLEGNCRLDRHPPEAGANLKRSRGSTSFWHDRRGDPLRYQFPPGRSIDHQR